MPTRFNFAQTSTKMKNKFIIVATLFVLLALACATNPVTGKLNWAIVGNNTLFPSAFQQYNQFLKSNKVVTGTADAKRVETVGNKIRVAAEKLLAARGQSAVLKDYQWEFKLIDSKEVNAWCMPGGKIAFYTGILPITKDEAGMAVVMGHEVAHALLNHGQQRMSKGILAELGAGAVGLAVAEQSPQTQALAMQAYGAGAQYGVLLPFSRSHETEADEIGLILMTIAGYNPDVAIPFWQRMAAQSGGQEPAEFMSTHPSNSTRIANIQKQIPIARREAAKLGVTPK